MKALAVINPKSGGGKGASIGGRVRAHFAKEKHEIHFIEAPSLEESLSQMDALCAIHDFEYLICVGGDGLIHDLLPNLLKHNLPLLVVPAGTGNDFARTIGLHGEKLHKILELPSGRTPHHINVAQIEHTDGSTPFVQILSTGFDSVVNERANNFKVIKGSIKYIIAVLLEIWRFRAIDFTLKIDEKVITQKAMLVCVANGTSYGGGMKIVPHAIHDDGLLDIMVVDRVNPLRLLLVFPRVFFGTHIKHPKVHFYSGRKIEVSGDTNAFADGERISGLPIKIEISEKALQVYKI